MTFLIKLLFVAAIPLSLFLLGLPVAALVAASMCFQNTPLVARKADISPADIEQAKRVMKKYDPSEARAGALRGIVVSQQDLDLILNYAAKGSARVVLLPGAVTVQASLPVRAGLFGSWLNVDARLRETKRGRILVDHLKIGSLPMIGIGYLALNRFMARLNATADGRFAQDMVTRVKLSEGQMQVVYEWRWDSPERMRAAALSQADQDRLKAYSDRLAEAIDQAGPSRSISLAQLMPPLFGLAQQRSAGGDARKENRAALVTLAFYSNGRGLSAIIPAAKEWRRPALFKVTLNGSDDFPMHFLISAAIAAEAGSSLADVIGLYKEVDDSRGGSAFSFNDIAAARAGARFGELAVKAPQKLQAALAAGVKEVDFMPDVSDLPGFMLDAEFRKRYGPIGVPAYNKAMADIDARVAASALYR
jgi:hypothetical protein